MIVLPVTERVGRSDADQLPYGAFLQEVNP